MSRKIIIVSGLPGVGKSTLAENIAEELGATILSVDPIESAIIKSSFGRSEKTGLAAYYVAETLAGEQLKIGKSVVIDAVNPVQDAWNMWSDLSEKYGAELKVIECVLDVAIHKQRVESRVRNMYGIPEVTWENVMERKQKLATWNGDKLVIDTANEPAQNLKDTLVYIG